MAKEKVAFSIACEQLKQMSKEEICRHLKELGCTWSYERIYNELANTLNDLSVSDKIFEECKIDDTDSCYSIDFIDEAVLEIANREKFSFQHYGKISHALSELLEKQIPENKKIDDMETLFRSLMKSAKQFQETSLEGLVYRVNDGMDMLGTLAYMLDIMMQEGRNDSSLYERIVKFVDKYLQVFTNTSEMVKMMLLYEQAQAYVAMHSLKGEKMFLDMLKTYRDKTEVVLHYGLAYIDDDVEKTLRIFKKYESLLDEESDSYEIIRQIQRDEQEG